MTEQASDTSVDQASNNDGNQDLGWRAALPDDLKNNEVLSGYSNIGDVSKDFLNLQSESANMVKRPGENPSAEEVASYHKAIGVPDSADGYEITKPDLPENFNYDEEFEQYYRKSMKEHGVPKAAAEAAYQDIMKFGKDKYTNAIQERDQEAEESQKALKAEWGSKFDENIIKRDRAIKRFAGDGAEELIQDANNIPAVSRVFHRVFEAMGEGFFVKGEAPQQKSETITGYDGKPILHFPSMHKTGTD